MSYIVRVPDPRPTAHHLSLESYVIQEIDNSAFLAGVFGGQSLHYVSQQQLATVNKQGYEDYNPVMYPFYGAPTSLMIQTLHGAFSGHKFISLRPDTLWYIIVSEVASHVHLNSHLYGPVFGAITDKQVIRTSQGGDWPATIERVGMGIMNIVGNEIMNLFLPAFTTTTREDQLAVTIALMDAISPYYEFRIDSICHIPEIQLEGEPVDWGILVTRTRQLREVFPALQAYFDHLLPILIKIEETVRTHCDDSSFWSSIYKYESSSDNHWVTGWITAFLAHFQTRQGVQPREYFGDIALTPDQFPSHVSVVHFLLNDTTEQQCSISALG